MASGKLQKNDRKAILRHLKPGGYGFTIAFFVIVLGISAIAIKLFIDAFLSYVIDNKVSSEYQNIQYLATIYEQQIDKNNALYDIIDKDNRPYVVFDENNNIVEQNGENTMGDTKGMVSIAGRPDGIDAYSDTTLPEPMIVSRDGEMEIGDYVFAVINKAIFTAPGKDGDSQLFVDLDKEDLKNGISQDKADKLLKKGISMPLWLGVNVKDGTEQFYGRAMIVLNFKDGMFLFIFIAAISVIIFAIVVMMVSRLFGAISARHKMWYLFFLDPVTKEKNWMYFVYKGEPIVKKRKYASTGFAVLDIVFVKYRNFCLCHSVEEGEELLRKVNRIIAKSLRKDEISTHYASANFATLLRYDDENGLKERIDTLLQSLKEVDDTHHFTFHIGVSELPVVMRNGKAARRRDVSLEKEYNNACAARATLSESDDTAIAFFGDKLVEEQKWIDTVRENQEKALENEEFLVYYQPKYDPQGGTLKGAEALIRWDSPKFGFKSPGTFIPIFEKNGFITEIDHYMISHVARDQKKWLDAGLSCVPVSVNVSRAHFIESDLAEQIRDEVDKAGAPHELIEIELTESAFFDDKKAIVTTIKKLKEYGFAVSMDDFGSGYSSLNSLKDMPLDVLKLDAGFFRGDAEGDRGEIVVSEAIKLAKSLNMRTVAEGVEIKDQVDFLARQGCDMIQGYYFAKPMPNEEYEKKLVSGVAFEESKEENADE